MIQKVGFLFLFFVYVVSCNFNMNKEAPKVLALRYKKEAGNYIETKAPKVLEASLLTMQKTSLELPKALKEVKVLSLFGAFTIKTLPLSLRVLYLYNTKIIDFSFLKKSQLKKLFIITAFPKEEKWRELKKKYKTMDIEVYDSLLFSLTIHEKKRLNDMHAEKLPLAYLAKQNDINKSHKVNDKYISEAIKNPKFSGIFWEISENAYLELLQLREQIFFENWEEIKKTKSPVVLTYVKKHYFME